MLADNKVGNYTLGCSAVAANRDLVSCDSQIAVNGIDPRSPQFNVAVSGGDEGFTEELEELFIYLGTDPMDYTYETSPVPPGGQFQIFDSGPMTILEIPGTTPAGNYSFTATNKNNPVDKETITLVISVERGVSTNGVNHTVGISGANGLEVVDSREMFNFNGTTPSEYNFVLSPSSPTTFTPTVADNEVDFEFPGTGTVGTYTLTATHKTVVGDTAVVNLELVLKDGVFPKVNIFEADVDNDGMNINIEALFRFNNVDKSNYSYVTAPEPPGGQYEVVEASPYLLLKIPGAPTDTVLYTFTATSKTNPLDKASIALKVFPRT